MYHIHSRFLLSIKLLKEILTTIIMGQILVQEIPSLSAPDQILITFYVTYDTFAHTHDRLDSYFHLSLTNWSEYLKFHFYFYFFRFVLSLAKEFFPTVSVEFKQGSITNWSCNMIKWSKCSGYLDYGKKKKCEVYDLQNCVTPHLPPICPVKEVIFKRPCYRYRCTKEDENTETVTEQTTDVPDQSTIIDVTDESTSHQTNVS